MAIEKIEKAKANQLSPKQSEIFDNADINIRTSRFGMGGHEAIISGHVKIDDKLVWIWLKEDASGSKPGYYAMVENREAGIDKQLRGDAAQKLFDFYRLIAELKTKPEEPVKREETPEEKSIEDKLLGGK